MADGRLKVILDAETDKFKSQLASSDWGDQEVRAGDC